MPQPITRPPITSLEVTRADLHRLQRVQLDRSAAEGRRVPLRDIVHDAVMLLVAGTGDE